MPELSRVDLLYATLALQLDLVDRDALVAAIQSFKSADPPFRLGDHLVDQGRIEPEAHRLLDELVERQLEKNGADAEKSLAALTENYRAAESLRLDPESTVASGFSFFSGSGGPSRLEATRPLSGGAGLSPRFRRERLHAKGGRGAVYEARDVTLGRLVAVKEIQDQFADNDADRLRFLLEAEITGQLEHPGIVPVYELGTGDDGRPFYVMRLIRGESLHEAIQTAHEEAGAELFRSRRTDLMRLLRHFVDICNTVDYAHSKGVIHRDIKPRNVMLGGHGETMVVDWGLAKFLKATEQDDPEVSRLQPSTASDIGLTELGSRVGTPAYMSPEQAAGDAQRVGPASDIYGLGATLYYLLTHQPPQTSKSTSDTLDRVRSGKFPPPRTVNRRVPAALEAVCLKAMALEPADRYRTARELSDDIDRWIADEPVSVAHESWVERSGRWMRRNRPWTVAGIATLVLVAVTAVAFSFVLERQKQRSVRLAEEKAVLADSNRLLARQFKDESDSNRLLADENAQLADQRQAALLESFERLAERDMQRGDWTSALATVNQAIDQNPAGRLLLMKAHILLAMNRSGEALAQVSEIATDDPSLIARTRLLEGDIRLGQDERARGLIREALGGLTDEADKVYAAALLCDDCVESANYLRTVVDLRPYHLRANQLLSITLWFLGEKDELAQRLATARAFFPDDPNLKLVHAMLLASQGHSEQARTVVQSMKAHLGSTTPIVEAIVDVFAGVSQVGTMSDQEREQFVNRSFKNIVFSYGKLKLLSLPFGSRQRDLEFVLPPSLEQAYGWIKEWEQTLKNPFSMLGTDIWETITPDRFMDRFQAATEVHPEGTVHWLLGLLLLTQGRNAEASEALKDALSYPSIVNFRPLALRMLVPLEMELSRALDGAARQARVERAMEFLRLLWAEGGLRPMDLPEFARLAIEAEHLDLSRDLARAWKDAWPNDPDAHAASATVALNSGAFVIAVERIDAALNRFPDHQELKRLHADAREKLDEAARRLLE